MNKGSFSVLAAGVLIGLVTVIPAAPLHADPIPVPSPLDEIGSSDPRIAASGSELSGLFKIKKGECSGSTVTGSWFKMVQPGGGVQNGPFIQNTDSECSDTRFTPLSPGADLGIATGKFQPFPEPKILRPQKFFGADFTVATNEKDPQTNATVAPPTITSDGSGKLTGDIRSFAVKWNQQDFNQGSPKPDGSTPGNTSGPSGTYNSTTKAYTLQWSSQIEGGPFDKFTGVWHFEGTFEPGVTPAGAVAPTAGGSSTSVKGATIRSRTGSLSNTGPLISPILAAILTLVGFTGFLLLRPPRRVR